METVHTVWEYYDGARIGVADYCGQPHYYVCVWDEVADDYSSIFALSSIDSDTLAWALEQWAIWRRWEIAFHSGQAVAESHPCIRGQDRRYDELQDLLQPRLDSLPTARIFARARFEPIPDETLPHGVFRRLLVEWSDASGPESASGAA